MSDNHIPIKYNNYKGKNLKPREFSIRNNADVSELAKAINDLKSDIRDISNEVNSFKKHYNDDNVLKSNKLITAIQRTTKATETSIIQGVSDGTISSGSSSTTNDITTVSMALVGGTATPVVFSAPATLVSIPISYSTVEGLVSAEIVSPTSLTVSGMTLTSVQDGTCVFSYKLL